MNKQLQEIIDKYPGNKVRGAMGDYMDELIAIIPEDKLPKDSEGMRLLERDLFMAIHRNTVADFMEGYL